MGVINILITPLVMTSQCNDNLLFIYMYNKCIAVRYLFINL